MGDVTYLPTPRRDTPTVPGLYVERHLERDLPHVPVYRLMFSGSWWLGGKQIPPAALPVGLARLGVVE